MGLHVKRTGFIDNQKMWASIFTDMKANGFTAVSVDGKEGAMIPADVTTLSTFVMDAGATVDPLAVAQPWRFCAKVTADSTQLYAATKNQITNLGEVSVLNIPRPILMMMAARSKLNPVLLVLTLCRKVWTVPLLLTSDASFTSVVNSIRMKRSRFPDLWCSMSAIV